MGPTVQSPYMNHKSQGFDANSEEKDFQKKQKNMQNEIVLKNLNMMQQKTNSNLSKKKEMIHQMQTSQKKFNLSDSNKFISANDPRSKKMNFQSQLETNSLSKINHSNLKDQIKSHQQRSRVDIINDEGKIFKRDGSQQPRTSNKQMQVLKPVHSHSIENSGNSKPSKNLINSMLTTGPSSSQHVMKQQHSEILDQKTTSYIQLKQVFVQNNCLPQKKQYIIFNQKQGDDTKHKIKFDAKEIHDSRNITLKDGQGFTTGAASQTKQKFEKSKIYSNQYTKNCNHQDIKSGYPDFGIKGKRSRINQNGIVHSRNSQISNPSTASFHNEKTGTYGGTNNQINQQINRNNTFNQSKESFKESVKNSWNNTKSSGFKHCISNQEIHQMEVRGNNLSGTISAMQNSNYGKFGHQSKSTNSKINQISRQNQQIVISKSKNFKKKQEDYIKFQNKCDLKQVYMHSEEQNNSRTKQTPDNHPRRAPAYTEQTPVRRTDFHQKTQKIQSHLKNTQPKCDSYESRNSQDNSQFDDLTLKVLNNRKSEQLTSSIKNNNNSLNYGVIKDKKNKNSNSLARTNQKQQYGQQIESDQSTLPQIFNQNKNEDSEIRSRSNIKSIQKQIINNKIDVFEGGIESNQDSIIFDSKLEAFGNMSNDKSINEGHTFEYNYSKKQIESMTDINTAPIRNKISQFIGKDNLHEISKIISSTSMSHHRPETQNASLERKQRVKNFNNGSIGQITCKNDDKQMKHYGIQLAPLQQSRENVGVIPGTANTQGHPNRTIHKKHVIKDSDAQLQYNFASQQCNSEVYNNKMNYQQNYYNNMSENRNTSFNHQAFENQFEQQFEKLDALDPNEEEMGNGNNFQGMSITRSQKSQGTYRQNYQKINQLINKYHNVDNYSMSEMYDQQSQNEVNVITSQLNDVQVNMGPNLSQNSDVENLIENKKNKKNDHPFDGPKLHLFKKGQSKSSQMKQRIAKSCEKNKSIFDENSKQNLIYSQNDAQSNHGFFPPSQQLSDGGQNYQKSLNNVQKVSQTKKGHINISEILKENRHNGVLANNIQNNFDKLITETKSQNSQGEISHSSFEIGQGTPLMIQGFDIQQPLLDYERGNKTGTSKQGIITSIEQNKNQQMQQQRIFRQQFSDILAYETRSQQCPSKMSTLQQNGNGGGEMEIVLPELQGQPKQTDNKLQNEPHLHSPYIPLNSNQRQNNKDFSEMSAQNSMMMNCENSSSTRPNTTNQVGGNIIIVNKNDNKVDYSQQQFTKNSKQAIKNYQHPKVGKNSKHPQVFKQNQSNLIKKVFPTNPSSCKADSQDGRNDNENNQQAHLFAQYVQNGRSSIIKCENELQPQQTGDFPSPFQIKQFNDELKQQESQKNLRKIQQDIKCQNGEDLISCNTSVKQNSNVYKNLQSLQEPNDKFQSLNLTDKRHNKDILIRQNSEQVKQYSPVKNEMMGLHDEGPNSVNQDVSHSRVFRTRDFINKKQQNLPEIGQVRFNENNHNKKRTIQHVPCSRFEEVPKKPIIHYSEPLTKPVNSVALSNKLQDLKLSQEGHSAQLPVNQRQIPTKPKQKMLSLDNKQNQLISSKKKEQEDEIRDDGELSNLSQYKLSDTKEDQEEETKEDKKENNSVAQTPCFAETPYTTDQFKGYKINPDPVTVPSMMQTGFSRHSNINKENSQSVASHQQN